MNSDPKIIQELHKNPFILAPMAGITDHAFRSFMKMQGAGIVVSELVSATGLEYKSKRTESLMSFDPQQSPVGIQLFGEKPEHVANAAKLVEQKGADFVDLNFGCPVPKVVKKGAGSAMLKDPKALAEMLRATKAAVSIPVTIKIRTGWDASTRNADEIVQVAYDEGMSWVAIHGRTRAQGYDGQADWEYIAGVKARAKLPIIGNGDVISAFQAVDYLQKYNLDGIMIGRGALKNPYIFREAIALRSQITGAEVIARDYDSLMGVLSEQLKARCDEYITQIQLKKFAAWFSSGYPGSALFRKNIYQLSSTDEIIHNTKAFFRNLSTFDREEPSHAGFLMGGHG